MTLRESERNERVWSLLGSVENHPQVQSWLRKADEAFADRSGPSRMRAFPKRRLWAAAASLVGAATGAAVLGYWHMPSQRYETRVGEQRDVILADGSRVTLNTNSTVVVRYSDTRRYLVLEHGEALFAVAHNAARPFDVAAGGTLTRALGTEFNVDMRKATVTVSVLEGGVQVSAQDATEGLRGSGSDPGATAGTPAAIAKGQAVEFLRLEKRVVQEKADLRRIDAWRMRRLEFSDVPLSEAVEEFNRYSNTQFVIGTPDLTSVRVSGVFRIADVDGFLYSLHEVLGVEAHQSETQVILMRTSP